MQGWTGAGEGWGLHAEQHAKAVKEAMVTSGLHDASMSTSGRSRVHHWRLAVCAGG